VSYDVIVIGGGASGEAAASLGAELGGKVALVERDLVGGECGFWACLPSKSLLDSAGRRALGSEYSWERASDRRDWMISREKIDYPSDASHVKPLADAGVEIVRGEAKVTGKGKLEVRSKGERPKSLEGHSLIISTGSEPFVPPIDGLNDAGFWTSRDATSTRDLPSAVVILGGGPIGVEMAQVYVRFGCRVIVVEHNDRILPRDHPRSSEALASRLKEEGVEMRLGVRAERVERTASGRVIHLSDGSKVEGSEVIVAVGRRPRDLRALGTHEAGIPLDDRGLADPDERMRVGDGVYVSGDAAGGLQFTHVADYEGRVAVRNALGVDYTADLNSVPRTTFTDPETAAVGSTVEEAGEKGTDAFEVTQDFATTARGYTIEGSIGHITAVIDRERGVLAGVFAACPGASELIHESVLALKQGIPVSVLADTIHAFPTGARVFGNLMSDALKQL
jgi:pyruvate/2-oxoglutarate dehydrogenase complex dihydrolipoamide dehydrogenase (E3) component